MEPKPVTSQISPSVSNHDLYHDLINMTTHEWAAIQEGARQMLGLQPSTLWTDFELDTPDNDREIKRILRHTDPLEAAEALRTYGGSYGEQIKHIVHKLSKKRDILRENKSGRFRIFDKYGGPSTKLRSRERQAREPEHRAFGGSMSFAPVTRERKAFPDYKVGRPIFPSGKSERPLASGKVGGAGIPSQYDFNMLYNR